jgi:hypothetical protein
VFGLLSFAKAEPNCQLVGDTKTFTVRAENGDDAGELMISIDQPSGQIRFDSFSSNGYKMYDQQIWFDESGYAHEMPSNPNDFFMKDQYPTGTTKWIGMWVVNPFFCGPQAMTLSFHSTMKGSDGSSVDAYAYETASSGYLNQVPHTETFQLQCTPCDEWVEPDYEEWKANLKPQVLDDLDSDHGTGISNLDTSTGTNDGSTGTTGGDSGTSSAGQDGGSIIISDGGGSITVGGTTFTIGGVSSSSGGGLSDVFTTTSSSSSSTSSSSTSTTSSSTSVPVTIHKDNWITRSADQLSLSCPETNNEAICSNLIVEGGAGNDMVVGDVCVAVNPVSNLLQVTVTSLESFALVTTQLWTGTGGIGDMPTKNGAPDTKSFEHFQCASSGRYKMRWEVPLADECGADDDKLEVAVLAHATVSARESSGRVIAESKFDAFAQQVTVEDPVFYGYMKVPVSCSCTAERRGLLRRARI